MNRKVSGLVPDAADQLLRYGWPGNVRELENTMERAVGTVRPLDDVEREYILASLALNGGNQTRTAQQLRIGSATLYRKLKSYGLIGRTGTAKRRRSDARAVQPR